MLPGRVATLVARLRRLRVDTDGSVLIVVAISLATLLGFMALTIDAGYFFEYKHQMESAADAAAVAGAMELSRDNAITNSNLTNFVRHDAFLNGFVDGTNGVSVVMNHAPTSGLFSGDTNYVEVIISQQLSTFFARILGTTSWTVVGRAVAGLSASSSCMVVLDATASGAYTAVGNAQVVLPDCGVVVNSNASTYALVSTNSAHLTATTVGVGGASPGYDTSGGGGITVTNSPNTVDTGVAAQADPLSYLVAPTVGSCAAHPSQVVLGAGNWSLGPGTYCGGIHVNGGGTLNLNGGIYIINGGQLTITNGATLNGSGVMIYNTGAGVSPVNFAGGTTINLSAQTTGSYAGVLIFQDRTQAVGLDITNGAGISLNGALYFKLGTVSFDGGSFSSIYTFLVANRVSFSGGAQVTLNSDTSSLPGGSPIKRVSIGE